MEFGRLHRKSLMTQTTLSHREGDYLWCWTCWGSKRKCEREKGDVSMLEPVNKSDQRLKKKKTKWEPKQLVRCKSWNTRQPLERCLVLFCRYVTCLVHAGRQYTAAQQPETQTEHAHLAISSTSSILQTSILLYTYKHFTYLLLPCMAKVRLQLRCWVA